MMNTVTEADVRELLPACRAAIENAIENVITIENLIRPTDHRTIYAAFQVAMIEKASELARLTFATSRVDFAQAARVLYKDDT